MGHFLLLQVVLRNNKQVSNGKRNIFFFSKFLQDKWNEVKSFFVVVEMSGLSLFWKLIVDSTYR